MAYIIHAHFNRFRHEFAHLRTWQCPVYRVKQTSTHVRITHFCLFCPVYVEYICMAADILSVYGGSHKMSEPFVNVLSHIKMYIHIIIRISKYLICISCMHKSQNNRVNKLHFGTLSTECTNRLQSRSTISAPHMPPLVSSPRSNDGIIF